MGVQVTYLVLIGGSLLAVYLVSRAREKEDFDETSYLAGWVTPGPLTIAAAVGGYIYFFR